MIKGIYNVKDYPEKSWSISRMKILKNCLRKYYYNYYGYHKGWENESTLESKVTWKLKKLKNINLLFGDIIHESLKDIIKYKSKNEDNCIDVDKYKDFVRRRLNIITSNNSKKENRLRWENSPNRGCMLQEYYYNGKLEKKDITEINEKIEQCVENIFESKTFFHINSKEFIKILETDEDNYTSFNVEGVKAYAQIDLLYVDVQGNYIIVDWKTGKYNEDDKEQLLVYALYVSKKYNIEIDRIKGRLEYLFTGENYEYDFSEEEVIEVENRIRNELNVIDAFLEDTNLNKPKDKENFIMCENNYKCINCNFRRLCNRERGEKDEVIEC